MTKRIKIDEDELRVKRFFTEIERNSKSAYNYNKKINQYSKKTIQNSKKTIQKNTPRGKEVVIKITGNSKNFQKWKTHFDYVTRKGELEVIEDELYKYQGKEELEQFKEFFNELGPKIPNDGENKKEKREVLHFIFSMKEHELTPSDRLMEAVRKSIKEKYPNNASYFVFHGDTDNPHIHCDLKIAGNDGKRIDVKKADLFQLRKDFAQNLRDLGIDATATKKYERTPTSDQIQNHHYEIVDFGKANYKFDEKEKESYFVKYKTTKGEIIDIWSKDLEKLVDDSQLKRGEFAKFKIIDKQPVDIVTFKNIDGKRKKLTRTISKNIWDISIQGRNEKEFEDKKLVTKKAKYKIEKIGASLAEFMKKKKEKTITSKTKTNKFAHLKKKNDIER